MSRTFPYIAALLALAATPVARATVVLGWSVEEMAKRAHRVAHVRAGESRTAWADGKAAMVTFTTLTVLDALKGTSEPITLRQVGGAIDGVESRIAGDARFAAGEEAVVFLERGPQPGTWVLLSMGAAKFGVVADARGKRVVRDLTGIAFGISRPGAKFRIESPPPSEEHGSLEEFKAVVRRALAR